MHIRVNFDFLDELQRVSDGRVGDGPLVSRKIKRVIFVDSCFKVKVGIVVLLSVSRNDGGQASPHHYHTQ